ncbi:hypothetical protein H8B06_11915 [Sphingobacterium sp. DN00404]|uniref:Lipoprotein n=1 Tax=Sphingobacterium micropteri TaxID=2763501 RepID=A0ABR7YQD6_9SPHI|nr:hypothetical protein [Sphingobacterium micropteri]MBD1433537.1 hypothetical protein [Sphingobacterium micropteri]
MKSIYVILTLAIALSACTSTRRLSNKFSEKPAVIFRQFSGAMYANSPTPIPPNRSTTSLWTNLAHFRQEKQNLPEVGDNAVIQLTLEKSNSLTVTAFQDEQQIARFDTPVRKRGKYLILENKTRTIPIPVLFFSLDEHKTILAPLENGSIGFYGYESETLMILFMGASKSGNFIHEYRPIEHMSCVHK